MYPYLLLMYGYVIFCGLSCKHLSSYLKYEDITVCGLLKPPIEASFYNVDE